MSEALFSELISSSPYAIIELFEIHLSQAIHGSAEIYRFHNGTNGKLTSAGDITWQGNAYIALPIEAEGFEYSNSGQLPRPKVRVANLFGTMSAILVAVNETYLGNDLTGAKFIRIRTLSRFLDPINFDGNVNPYGTPADEEMPREIYYIDRKTAETRDFVEFELASVTDLAGVRAPKRQCIANLCQWKYRSAECGYTGTNYFDANDNAINSSPAPDFPAGSAQLNSGQSIFIDQALRSANGWFRTLLQADGNLVTYRKNNTAAWSSKTVGGGSYRLSVQSDGNAVIYTSGNESVWSTGTAKLGTAVALQFQGWLPDETNLTGRAAAFWYEVLGDADSYPNQSRTVQRQFIIGSRTITLSFTATSYPLGEPFATETGKSYFWNQPRVLDADTIDTPLPYGKASVVSSTGLWQEDEIFGAAVAISAGNPWKNRPTGTLTTITAQYRLRTASNYSNNYLIQQNDGNLVLYNASSVALWSSGFVTNEEPRVVTGSVTALQDVCGKRLSSCKKRFGEFADLPFGSYPGVGNFYG